MACLVGDELAASWGTAQHLRDILRGKGKGGGGGGGGIQQEAPCFEPHLRSSGLDEDLTACLRMTNSCGPGCISQEYVMSLLLLTSSAHCGLPTPQHFRESAH